jgi:uncharacterized protein (TIGR02996 family)
VRLETGRRRDGRERRLIETLVAELAERPDDVELVRVFADWLLQQGHPAGELVMVQLERLVHDSEALQKREYDLIWNHAEPHMKAVLARDHVTELEWRRGLLHGITLHHHGGEEALDETLRRLASDPCGRLVRRLVISAVQFDGAGNLEPAIAALASLSHRFIRLRELVITEGANLGSPWIEGPIHVGDLTPLYPAYPQLEVLEIGGKETHLGALSLPALRRLALDDITPVHVTEIAAASLDALEELELFFGRWRVDAIDPVFRPLLDRVMPKLATLAIAAEVPQVMQYVVRAVPAAALSRQTRILSFYRGPLDADCVRTLVQWAPRLRALHRLEVDARGLSVEGRRQLEQTFGRLLVVR